MRVAVAVATADALPSAFVVWRGIEESIRKAAAYGYDGIELALKTADQVDPARLKHLLAQHGLACPCVSTGQVFAGLSLYFTSPDPARRDEAKRVFRELIDLASQVGAMINIGRVRGFIAEGQTRREAELLFCEAIHELAPYGAARGVKLLLEPVNRYEINFINSLAEAAELLNTIGEDNLWLMPDLFHMNIEDPSLPGALERYADKIAYVHVADSNRLAPGQGHIDFNAVFAALKRVGYDGWISVEILPKPDPDTAARQAINYLRPLVDAYNRA